MTISQPSFKPLVGIGATTPTITNLSLPTVNTEVSHILAANLKTIIIRNRDKADMQLAFVITESATKYLTIKAGAVISLERLEFSGQILYIQSPKISIVEILELS